MIDASASLIAHRRRGFSNTTRKTLRDARAVLPGSRIPPAALSNPSCTTGSPAFAQSRRVTKDLQNHTRHCEPWTVSRGKHMARLFLGPDSVVTRLTMVLVILHADLSAVHLHLLRTPVARNSFKNNNRTCVLKVVSVS